MSPKNHADHENIGYLPDIEELNEDTVTSMRQFLTYSREAGTHIQQGGRYSPTAERQVFTYKREAGTHL